MRTRSQSRRNRHKNLPELGTVEEEHTLKMDDEPPHPPKDEIVPDTRTIEELCQPTMHGRGGPIAPLIIGAADFGLKHHMIQQVHNSCQFHGLPGEDANKHLDKFLTVTQSMKQNGVTDDGLRLYLFPYSLTHHAIPGSINFQRIRSTLLMR